MILNVRPTDDIEYLLSINKINLSNIKCRSSLKLIITYPKVQVNIIYHIILKINSIIKKNIISI